ncbi:MAG: hypothetical protein HKO66_10260 [Saprospiraceae bacterium]|nr:hypothetical protein [Bacteroidia bacterium]NNE14708.1 hypothetical protein [Saprospiraceae bacterium]NNL92605.1 hypothetical protein [Saprospiraceae bacterium]
MNEKSNDPIYSVKASIWNGSRQLPGTLELGKKNILFKFSDFTKSHLKLQIPLIEISKIEEYLLFELARCGLKILNKNGHFDLFVMENAAFFKKKVIEELTNQNIK